MNSPASVIQVGIEHPAKISRSKLIASFLEFLRVQQCASANTVLGYRVDLVQFEQFVAGQIGRGTGAARIPADVDDALLQCKPMWVAEFVEYLRGQNYKGSSMARKVASLRSLCRYLMRRGLMAVNPMSAVAQPRRPAIRHTCISRDQLDALLNAPGDGSLLAVRDTAMLRLLLCTGIKVSELVEMKRADLDLTGRKVLIAGLGNRRRWLPITDEVAAALDRYLHMNDATGRFIPAFAGRAFLNLWGSALSARSVRRKMAKYLEIAGLPANIKAYDLRYSFAKDLLNVGTDLSAVKRMLGGRTFSARTAYQCSLSVESGATKSPSALPIPPLTSAA